jgi:hypothetical protein
MKVTLPVTWGMGGASPANPGFNSGSGNAVIWLLASETGGATFTATTTPCGTRLPDLILNSAGAIAVGGVPMGGTGKVQIQIPDSSFDTRIARTYPVSGAPGWSTGDMISTQPMTGLLGLGATSPYEISSTAWPASCASSANCSGVTCSNGACSGGPGGPFMGSEITDDDGDGLPGITAIPLTSACDAGPGCNYYDPPLSVGLGGSAPVADAVYVVSRNGFALSAVRGAECTRATGHASVTLFDTHVVGCHVKGGPDCTSAQVSFLDVSRPIFVDGQGNAFGSSSPANNATVDLVQFPQGTSPTCTDVRTMLP